MGELRDGKVLAVVYTVMQDRHFRRTPTQTAEGLVAAVRAGEWPYDPADDPAFYCARRFADAGGRITWGLCRRNVRCNLLVGDTVCFFGQEKEGSDTYYRFCGWATVDEKIDQSQIWTEDRYAVYRDYLNLLVEPTDEAGRYRHQENHPGDIHKDWLERLIRRAGYRWREGDFKPWQDPHCEKTVHNGVDHTPSGQPIRFARNYVIFAAAPAETLLLADPPLVAVHESQMGVAEEWLDDDVAAELKELVVGLARNSNRGLRSSPTRFRHSPMPLTAKATEWRRQMIELVERSKLTTV